MQWIVFLRELDEARSKVRQENLNSEVDWAKPFLQNLLFVLTENKVTIIPEPIVEAPKEAAKPRVLMVGGQVINKGKEEMKITPIPRQPDNTVNKSVDLVQTDKDGAPLAVQPAWNEGDT